MRSLDELAALDRDFDQLVGHLRGPASLAAGQSDPIFYFVYPPELTLEVQRRLPVWTARLRDAGLTAVRVSFSHLIWDLIEASGRWDAWLEAEAEADPEDVNEAIQNVLRNGAGLVGQVAALVERERPGTVIFLTETEMLYPYFRVRVLESALHDRIKVPVVIFYPGRRSGQFGLHFLGFYPDDPNYRATLIGGLP